MLCSMNYDYQCVSEISDNYQKIHGLCFNNKDRIKHFTDFVFNALINRQFAYQSSTEKVLSDCEYGDVDEVDVMFLEGCLDRPSFYSGCNLTSKKGIKAFINRLNNAITEFREYDYDQYS